MQCIHRTSDRTRAHLLRSALEVEGIAAIVQGEHLTAIQGELPVGASADYRVCIVDDEQLPRASRLTKQWLAAAAGASAAPWACEICGEQHEAQFESCWKCGAHASPRRRTGS
jgi:hypothetical protein